MSHKFNSHSQHAICCVATTTTSCRRPPTCTDFGPGRHHSNVCLRVITTTVLILWCLLVSESDAYVLPTTQWKSPTRRRIPILCRLQNTWTLLQCPALRRFVCVLEKQVTANVRSQIKCCLNLSSDCIEPAASKVSLLRRQSPKRVYKHLYRNYDDISFDSWLRCLDPQEFLLSVGFTVTELKQLPSTILQQNVFVDVAPKVRWIVEALQGGSGILTWGDDSDRLLTTTNKEDEEEEECNKWMDYRSDHSMRLSNAGKQALIVTKFLHGCSVDRTLGPRHAFLTAHQLPHGPALIEKDSNFSKLLELVNVSQTSCKIDDFVQLCNDWADCGGTTPHTVQEVQIFEDTFCRGLLHVIQRRDESMVELLVQHGANTAEKDSHGVSLLHWAAGMGELTAVKTLMRNDLTKPRMFVDRLLYDTTAKEGATPFHWAVVGIQPGGHNGCSGSGGSYDICCYMLEHAGEYGSELACVTTWRGNSALMWAAWAGSVQLVELLCQYGADPTVTNSRGQAASHWAAASGQIDACCYLQDSCSLDFTSPDMDGRTPLDYAAMFGRTKVVEWLTANKSSASSSPSLVESKTTIA